MIFPPAAQAIVDRIRSLLAEARRLGLDRVDGREDSYVVRETRVRYLPETLAAYRRIPPGVRAVADADTQRSPDELLVAQLTILEGAVAECVARGAEAGRSALAVNGRFLELRFGNPERVSDSVPLAAPESAPERLARFFFARVANRKGRDVVNAIATRLHEAFPLMTCIDRGVFSSGRARRLEVTVPLRNDRLLYTLALDAEGEFEPRRTTMSRGVVTRSESVRFDDWIPALVADLYAYAHDSLGGQAQLQALLR